MSPDRPLLDEWGLTDPEHETGARAFLNGIKEKYPEPHHVLEEDEIFRVKVWDQSRIDQAEANVHARKLAQDKQTIVPTNRHWDNIHRQEVESANSRVIGISIKARNLEEGVNAVKSIHEAALQYRGKLTFAGKVLAEDVAERFMHLATNPDLEFIDDFYATSFYYTFSAEDNTVE